MIRIFRNVFCICLCAVLITLCGCKEEGTDSAIYADVGEKITTLDPQLVSSESEKIIVHNLYEGLTRLNEKGEPVLALAENFEKNGNTYTFYLKDKLLWNDGTALTADDFVFAFRRGAGADTDAPDFQYVACIKGANAVRNGADAKTLAVTAEDDRTLKITLENDDGKLLYYLSKPICMPCNEKFFKSTNGKYGRDKESVLSNGPFRLRTWTTENYAVRLKRNENYTLENTAIPASVYITSNDKDTLIQNMADGKIDLSLIKSAHYEKLADKGLTIDKYFNRCWFIVINKNSALGDADIRKALCLSLSREALEKSLPAYISTLDCYISQNSTFLETDIYSAVKAKNAPVYDSATAYTLYSNAVKKQQSEEPLTIIFPENEGLDSAVTSVASSWQENLGCFINMSALGGNSAVMSAINSGNYTVAVMGLDANSGDAYEFLSNFNPENLSSLRNAKTAEEYTNAIVNIQKSLFANNEIIPLVTTPTMLCYESDLSDVFYNTQNGFIDFTRIIKK